ncbi:MAG TPA: hypothetical protein DIT58_06505, partial [Porticoccaceae bacterium]|nr:hypothetical protein [Porticoccaceae bacterium]
MLLALIFLLLGPEIVVATDEGVAAPTGTWRGLDALTGFERQRLDLNTANNGGEKTVAAYLPQETWPFEAPFSAQEIGFRIMDFSHIPRWSHVMADAFGVLTKAGYLTQGVTVGMVDQPVEPGARAQINAAPGEIYSRQIFFDIYPPKNRGLQQMWLMRRTGADNPEKLDFFVYSPSLRRVRRQPPPRREAQFPDVVQSFDDITGREAWELDWRLLGADTLYETVRFPTTRKQVTLGRSDGSFYDMPVSELKMMGDAYPFYREDGG